MNSQSGESGEYEGRWGWVYLAVCIYAVLLLCLIWTFSQVFD